jgi:hypothetical protein
MLGLLCDAKETRRGRVWRAIAQVCWCVSINIHQSGKYQFPRSAEQTSTGLNRRRMNEYLALGLQYAYEHHVHEHHAKCQHCQSYYIKVHRWTGTDLPSVTDQLATTRKSRVNRAQFVSLSLTPLETIVNSGPHGPFRVRTLITDQFLLTPVRPGMTPVSSRRSPDL